MIPSGQRFKAGNRLVRQPNDRLIENPDLLAAEGAAKIRLERSKVAAVLSQRRSKRLDPVATELFGMVHADLGILDQFLRFILLAVKHGNANRRDERHLPFSDRDRRPEGASDRLGKGGNPFRVTLRGEEKGELVAFDAGEGVLRFQEARQPSCDGQQNRVAHRQPELFIDLFESVDIEDEYRWPRRSLRIGSQDRGA